MRALLLRSIVAITLAGGLTVAGGVAHAVGAGTFTRITTPAGPSFTYHYLGSLAQNSFTVSGQASLDVSEVDIDCLYTSTSGGVQVLTFATAVPVSGGIFSATATYTQEGTVNCRLRAVPTGQDPTTHYVGSYSGPILYTDGFLSTVSYGRQVGYTAISERGDALTLLSDAGTCGAVLVATVSPPSMLTGTSGSAMCAFALGAANIAAGGTPTHSAVRVDGHDAYLPSGVASYLKGGRGLPVTQDSVTVTHSLASNGDQHFVERSTLVRCTGINPDTYPPTNQSCSSLVSTGVAFSRVYDVIRGSHQIRVRDVFSNATAASHVLSLQYEGQLHPAPTGRTGYVFPGHSSAFGGVAPDQVITGLGSKAATVLVRSDVYAGSDDPAADTLALTWSKAPSSIRFDHSLPNYSAMNYGLSVPAHGTASIGFAYSDTTTTSAVRPLAASAVGEMMNAPSISSPANGATIKGRRTTVKGTVTAGANGLPTKVVVNGHLAKLTRVSATAAAFAVSFSESYGRHVLTATAYDAAGNAKGKSIRIRNTA